jgi:hypothetical protein
LDAMGLGTPTALDQRPTIKRYPIQGDSSSRINMLTKSLVRLNF